MTSEQAHRPIRPLDVLLTNDDGIFAQGIRHLFEVLSLHHNVTVVAPQSEQSGIGHAFTFNAPLYCQKIEADHEGLIPGYAISGTPSDCVKFALAHLLPKKPDVIISGMNMGENSGTCNFYSGTVAAAREGALWQIPSFAFSCQKAFSQYSQAYADSALHIIESLLHTRHPDDSGPNSTFYNINFPDCSPVHCKGVRITRQSLAFFDDRYRVIIDDDGIESYMVAGEKTDIESSDHFDSRAMLNSYIAITPMDLDATAEKTFDRLKALEHTFDVVRSNAHV